MLLITIIIIYNTAAIVYELQFCIVSRSVLREWRFRLNTTDILLLSQS